MAMKLYACCVCIYLAQLYLKVNPDYATANRLRSTDQKHSLNQSLIQERKGQQTLSS